MATFGNTSDGANVSNWSIDRRCLSAGTPSTSGTATKLTARIWLLGGAGTCKVKGVIYGDSGGSAGSLLAVSDEVNVTNTTEQAVDLPLSGANQINVTASTVYWIGYHNEDPGAIDLRQSRGATAGAQKRQSDTYSDGPADPSGAMTDADGPIDCYVTYTEASGSVAIFPSHLTLLGIG